MRTRTVPTSVNFVTAFEMTEGEIMGEEKGDNKMNTEMVLVEFKDTDDKTRFIEMPASVAADKKTLPWNIRYAYCPRVRGVKSIVKVTNIVKDAQPPC